MNTVSRSSNDQIKLVARQSGLILLYHSVTDFPPAAMSDTLHNVSTKIFSAHIDALSAYFKFVPLDQFAQAESKSGLAAITFDDGYKNTLQNALPILEQYGYCSTLFLNPVTFEKRFNWRDKVRYLIHHQLVDEFLSTYEFAETKGRFYRYSKHPDHNSASLDLALDAFLSGHVIDIYGEYPYLTEADLIIEHPLMSYGNHSYNHYVLSSLTPKQQEIEIKNAMLSLQRLKNVTVSDCFSAPFGGSLDINELTYKIVSELDYSSLLMSRQRLNSKISSAQKVQVLERFMPRTDDIFNEIISVSLY